MKAELNYNQEKKEKREWAILQIFRSSYQAFPLGKIEKSERPDFFVHSDKKGLIGIELTELKYEREDKKFNLRAHEDFLNEVMEGSQAIVEAKCDFKLVVDVHFGSEFGPELSMSCYEKDNTLMKQGLSEAIAKIVMENLPEATGIKYKIDRTSKYGDMNLPTKIDSIFIRDATGRLEEGLWYAGISTKVKPLSISSISQRLVAKNTKLPFYNHACKETWLIIIQNSFLMSSSYDPQATREALRHTYKSDFDRVFVFERSEGGVTLLRTKKFSE